MASYKLDLETPKRNVFVTQLRDNEDEDSSDVKKYPIVHESTSKLVSTGIKTLQSTLLIKQTAEVGKVQQELEHKRQAHLEKMAACKMKEERLRKRQQQIKERVNKFDKFIKETEAKRRRALEKYQTEYKLKEQKTRELEVYSEELMKLKQRQLQLQKKVEKYSAYKNYLMKVLDIIPDDYIENSGDSMLLGIMMRFNTLQSTYQLLSEALASKTDEIKEQQQVIQDIVEQYNQELLVESSELAALQHELEGQTHQNAQQEHILQTSEEIYRNQSTKLGKVKLAVLNIAEKCVKRHSRPLANMNIYEMLTLIKDFLREHEDICRAVAKADTLQVGNIIGNETLNTESSLRQDYTSRKSLYPIHSHEIISKDKKAL